MSKITWLDPTKQDETAEDPHFRVTLKGGEDFFVDQWAMTIDLTEMCNAAGKRVKDYDVDKGCEFYRVDLPVPRFKKALKLIIKHGEPDLVDHVQWYLDEHFPKWGKEFGKLRY